MKIVIIGASNTGVLLARQLIAEGHEVVLLEKEHRVAEAIAGELDCAVLSGDPVSPRILGEIEVDKADYVIAVTDSDKDNLLAALNARAQGARNIVVVLENEDYHRLAVSLGFFHIVSPTRLAVVQINALIKGMDIANLSTILRGDAAFYVGVVHDKLEGKKLGEIGLPDESVVVAVYRGEELLFPKDDLELRGGDEVVVFTRRQKLEDVKKTFS